MSQYVHKPVSSIVVFGEALVDIFKQDIVVGGAPFNVARHLAGLGVNPYFISAIGQDNAGDLIQRELHMFGMEWNGVQVIKHIRSGCVEVHEDASGHRFDILKDCAYDFVDTSKALAGLVGFNRQVHAGDCTQQIVYHGTLGLRSEVSATAFDAVLAESTQRGAKVFLDVNWREGFVSPATAMKRIEQADYIKVSVEELIMVLAWYGTRDATLSIPPKQDAQQQVLGPWMRMTDTELLFVTYGAEGSAVFGNDGRCLAVAAASPCHKLVDTVGAGDAFSAVMLYALMMQWPMNLALTRANQFASDICGIRGATPADLRFYPPYINTWHQAVPNYS